MNTRVNILFICILVQVTTSQFCLDKVPISTRPTVVLGQDLWVTSELNVKVAKIILEEKLQIPVRIALINETVMFQMLSNGDVHGVLEYWTSGSKDQFEYYVNQQRTVKSLSALSVIGRIGWYFPSFVRDLHPDIATWSIFSRPRSLSVFNNTIYIGPSSWVSYDEDIIRNNNLNLTVVRLESEQEIIDTVNASYQARNPILFYFWEPHILHQQLNLTRVSLRDYTDACYANRDNGTVYCDYPQDILSKLAWSGLQKYSVPAWNLVNFFNYQKEDQNSMLYDIANGVTVDQAACNWIRKNEPKWDSWVTDYEYPEELINNNNNNKDKKDLQLGLGLGIGLGLFMLILFVVGLFVILKHKKKRSYGDNSIDLALAEPNWVKILFPRELVHSSSKVKKEKAFHELIVNTHIVKALALVSRATSTEAEIASYLAYVVEAKKDSVQTILTVLEAEMDAGKITDSELFRMSSLSTRLFVEYSKLIGSKYLWENLGPFIQKLDRDPDIQDQTEIDPKKMEEMDDEIANSLQLHLLCQRLFRLIIKSSSSIPSELHYLCYQIVKKVQNSHPQASRNNVLAAFVFLRFYCCALTSPTEYGLLEESPAQSTRRTLVLLAKVLQTLANNSRFEKEQYMQKLNDFIENNTKLLEEFYSKLSTLPTEVFYNDGFVRIPPAVIENSLNFLYEYCYKHRKAIGAILVKDGQKNLKIELNTCFSDKKKENAAVGENVDTPVDDSILSNVDQN